LQLNLNIFRTQSIMLTTMLRKKILMIKELYKTENMCFCQSIFIQLVHVFNQKWSKLAGNGCKIFKIYTKMCAPSYWCTYMIKTQAAHQQIQSFSFFCHLFVWIHPVTFFHSESSLSFILCYTSSARFVRLCRIYRICDTCFCCLCPCITTCFWYLILWSLKMRKRK